MSPETLELLAAGLLWACLLAYTVTGLADYGGGIWDLLAVGPDGERQRRLIATVLAPIWEVNHIWLIAVVVLAFTCFPGYFSWYSRALHLPLVLMLLGLVFRGAAFTFRAYDPEEGHRRWGRIFGVASLLTPAGLGICLGAILSEDGSWRGAFPAGVATVVVLHGAVLAAVYLVGAAPDEKLRREFRRRALVAAMGTAGVALGTLALASDAAPRFFSRLTAGWPAIALHQVTAGAGVGLLAALHTRRDAWLRPLVLLQSLALVAGLALAQYPYLRYPEFSIHEVAAHPTTLAWTLGVFAAGSVLLVPALATLAWVFRGQAEAVVGDRGTRRVM